MIASDQPTIFIPELSFGYRGRPLLFKLQDFKVTKGEKLFIHGPSGSGKTTLLSLLAGVLHSPQKIEILGRDLSRMSSSERDRFRGEHLGYIFQMFNLIPYLSVRENILLPAQIHPQRRARSLDLEKEVRELAQAIKIENFLESNVLKLSVGQQQRVAVARALIGHPELVIADEPTSALDRNLRDEFLNLLFERVTKNGATLVFVSHDLDLSSRFDRTFTLGTTEGTAEALTKRGIQ